jgi:hypothetical protein
MARRGRRNTMRIRTITAFVAAAVAVTAIGSLALSGDARGATVGGVHPADFTDPRPNIYFPLEPGTVSRYVGAEDGERFRERIVVTHPTREVAGVTTVVVLDVLRVNGELAERTEDWYQADDEGNVWYFGEDTAEYEDGEVVSTSGSWEAGVDGAVAGIVMPAEPRPTVAYRQEFYRGAAEDQAWIVRRNDHVTVPYGDLDHVVRTYEWSRLEPGVMGLKLYAPGLGIVRERLIAGGTERLALASVERT